MRLFKLALVAGTFALALAPASHAQDYKIGYSVFWGTNPYLVTMVAGAKAAAKEWQAKGVNIDLLVTNGGDTDTARQVSDLEDLYAQGVKGVLIFPGDSVMIGDTVTNVFNAEKIPVVITDIGIRSGDYVSQIVTDNYAGGRQAGDYMAHHLPKGSKVVTLDNAPTSDNGQARQRGFEDAAREAGLVVLAERIVPTLTLDSARRAAEDLLVADPDVKGIFTLNQLILQGAYQVIDQAGRAGDITLTAFDVDPISYKMVLDGKIDALVVQDPYRMGYDGMNSMIVSLEGGTVDKNVDLHTRLLTRENVETFASDPQIAAN
ncbi:substrate-binding domain-containing protein [Sinorhizobium meliloti]|uniref:substrate-binding domain-containing protein n=1 Tax=Rhizobium meliloti TaxID=382 RepID=UPI00398D4406